MNPDIALAAGVILGLLAVLSLLSSAVESRAPWLGALGVLAAGGLVAYALRTQPGGYALEDVPEALVRVLAMLL